MDPVRKEVIEMSKMCVFHELLAETDRETDSYIHPFALLPKASRTQIQELKSDLDWTSWRK
jgi:hypothetical protein